MAEAEVRALLARLSLDRYADGLVDAGFDTLQFLSAATMEDFQALGLRMGHARSLFAELHKTQLQIEPATAPFFVDPSQQFNAQHAGSASVLLQSPTVASHIGLQQMPLNSQPLQQQQSQQPASVTVPTLSIPTPPFAVPAGVVWMSLDPRVNVWVAYPDPQNAAIESYYMAGQPTAKVAFQGAGEFIIDFASMRQRNTSNQTRRVTRRLYGLLDAMNPLFSQEEKDLNSHMQDAHEHYVLRQRQLGLPAIVFKLTFAALVHNPLLHQRYLEKLKHLQGTTGCQISEALAFHCTSSARNIQGILHDGLLPSGHPLNPTLPSAQSSLYFGCNTKGVYLCRTVDDALKYANGHRPLDVGASEYVIVFRVIIGTAKSIPSFSGSEVPPSAGYHSHISPDGREYFLYDPAQCYPIAVWLVNANHASAAVGASIQSSSLQLSSAAFPPLHPSAGLRLTQSEFKNLQPRTGGYFMEVVDSKSSAFQNIAAILNRTKSDKHRSFQERPYKSFTVKSVVSLLNEERFNTWTSMPGEHVLLGLHGTTAYACTRINDEGFKPSIAGSFGSGMYLTDISSVAAIFSSDPYYFTEDTRLFALVCWVKCSGPLGKLTFNKDMTGSENVTIKGNTFAVSKSNLSTRPVTECAFANGLREILVQDADVILPAFMVEFSPREFQNASFAAAPSPTTKLSERPPTLQLQELLYTPYTATTDPVGYGYDVQGSWRLDCDFVPKEQFSAIPWVDRDEMWLTPTELASMSPDMLRKTEFHLEFTSYAWSPCHSYAQACPARQTSSCQSSLKHKCFGRKRLGLRRNHETGVIEMYAVATWGKQFFDTDDDPKMVKRFGKQPIEGDRTGAVTLFHWLLFFRVQPLVLKMLISLGAADISAPASSTGILPSHVARAVCAIDDAVQLEALPHHCAFKLSDLKPVPAMTDADCQALFGY